MTSSPIGPNFEPITAPFHRADDPGNRPYCPLINISIVQGPESSLLRTDPGDYPGNKRMASHGLGDNLVKKWLHNISSMLDT